MYSLHQQQDSFADAKEIECVIERSAAPVCATRVAMMITAARDSTRSARVIHTGWKGRSILGSYNVSW
jgi:hypothetical protein